MVILLQGEIASWCVLELLIVIVQNENIFDHMKKGVFHYGKRKQGLTSNIIFNAHNPNCAPPTTTPSLTSRSFVTNEKPEESTPTCRLFFPRNREATSRK